nr:putative late blight resistance protein homolog R1A-10 isoform X1 [Ipomoea batatas]
MYPKLDAHTGFNRYGSLFCFHDDVGRGYRLPATPHFKRLRVLDLGSLHFIEGIPSYVANLVLLRYLALRPSKSLNSLPVLKDWNLQSLVLLENWGGSTSADNPNPLIPAEIWELPKLRHLQVCTTFVLGTPTAVHQYLQTVQWLRPFHCTEQVFLKIPNAKVMGIFMEGSVEFGEPNCLNNLRYLHQLEELKIESRHFYPFLLPVVDAFPVQLKKLKLKGTLVPWDAMTVIGMLPNLQVLKLKNGACQGGYWKLTEGSFRQLKSLLIYGSGLRHWEATGDNDFPVLERLILKECYELEEIPSSFREILTLKLIELCHCYSRLVNSAKQIQEEQREYGNYELVVHAYNIWPVQSLKSGVVEDVKVIGFPGPILPGRSRLRRVRPSIHVIACRNRNNFDPVHECIRAGRGGEGYVELLVVIHVNDILFLDQRVDGCAIGAEVTQQELAGEGAMPPQLPTPARRILKIAELCDRLRRGVTKRFNLFFLPFNLSVVLSKSSSWSRSVRNSSRVLVVAFSSWIKSMEIMSVELVTIDRSSRSKFAKRKSAELINRSSVAIIVPSPLAFISWSRSMKNSSRVLVNPLFIAFDCHSWSRSVEIDDNSSKEIEDKAENLDDDDGEELTAMNKIRRCRRFVFSDEKADSKAFSDDDEISAVVRRSQSVNYDVIVSTQLSNAWFNSNCKETSEWPRKGWRCWTGELADLGDRCTSAYKEGKFCETTFIRSIRTSEENSHLKGELSSIKSLLSTQATLVHILAEVFNRSSRSRSVRSSAELVIPLFGFVSLSKVLVISLFTVFIRSRSAEILSAELVAVASSPQRRTRKKKQLLTQIRDSGSRSVEFVNQPSVIDSACVGRSLAIQNSAMVCRLPYVNLFFAYVNRSRRGEQPVLDSDFACVDCNRVSAEQQVETEPIKEEPENPPGKSTKSKKVKAGLSQYAIQKFVEDKHKTLKNAKNKLNSKFTEFVEGAALHESPKDAADFSLISEAVDDYQFGDSNEKFVFPFLPSSDKGGLPDLSFVSSGIASDIYSAGISSTYQCQNSEAKIPVETEMAIKHLRQVRNQKRRNAQTPYVEEMFTFSAVDLAVFFDSLTAWMKGMVFLGVHSMDAS